MDRLWQNLGDELGRKQQQADSILYQVWMQIWPLSGIQNVNGSAQWRYVLYQLPFSFDRYLWCDWMVHTPFSSLFSVWYSISFYTFYINLIPSFINFSFILSTVCAALAFLRRFFHVPFLYFQAMYVWPQVQALSILQKNSSEFVLSTPFLILKISRRSFCNNLRCHV